MKRSGFTLMEMMVSVTILSIMMVFLYKSFSEMKNTNLFFQTKAGVLESYLEKKKTVFLDFSLAHFGSVKILNQDKYTDVVFMQTSNSLYGRINPYVAYIKKEDALYRLESLLPFTIYPLNVDADFFGEKLGEVKSFRVYEQSIADSNSTYKKTRLVHMDFAQEEDLLYKITSLNEY
jgi:prepilin-type N-terminal cleavage/methylation domain-containing protein